MSNRNKKLDELLKKEWHKKFRLFSIAFAIMLVIAFGFLSYLTGDTTNVNAVVTGFHSQASESNESYYIVAELKSGEIKIVKVAREAGLRKGDTVILNKRKTNFFGFLSYSFNMVNYQQ